VNPVSLFCAKMDVSRSNGGLRILGWIGQLSCLTIFSTSLSVAAFLYRAEIVLKPWNSLPAKLHHFSSLSDFKRFIFTADLSDFVTC